MSRAGIAPPLTTARQPGRRRAAWVGRAATTALAGAMATLLTACHVTGAPMLPTTSPSGGVALVLTSVESPASPLQTVIDQLLEAQQQVVATNSNYPFVTPFDLTLLHQPYTQDLGLTVLSTLLNEMNINQFHNLPVPQNPYPWNAPATDEQSFLTYTNPDDQYHLLEVNPSGPGTEDVSFTPSAGISFQSLGHAYDLANATPNANGSYTIILSSTPQQGNWVDTAGANTVLVRDSVGSWGQIHDSSPFR